MIGTDRDAVICDLAETYHVLDYRALPVDLLATLCAGLHEDSRIKMELAGMQSIPAVLPLVRMADSMTVLLSGLAGRGALMPELFGDVMTGKHKGTIGYTTPEDFEAARRRLIGE